LRAARPACLPRSIVARQLLSEQIERADEDDVAFLQVGVEFSGFERVHVAHALVVARTLGQFQRVAHLHFNVKDSRAESKRLEKDLKKIEKVERIA